MLILIPTYGRVDKQVTWDHLCPELRRKTFLVVSEAEANGHRDRFNRQTIICPVQGKGMAAVRSWIMNWALTNGHPKILMMDDDLKLQKRRADMRATGTVTAQEQIEMVRWSELVLEKYTHCAFSRRNEGWADHGEYRLATKGIQVVGYNFTKVAATGCRFNLGVPDWFFMEDYHMTLQLLKKGLPNIVSRVYRINFGNSNAAGGCSSFRTPERMEEASKLLELLHPECVTATQKTTKTSYGGGSRWDVRVFWRKAHSIGQNQIQRKLPS
jgi:hypothetical protein